MTLIRVRRGINGYRYAACDEKGYFIRNFEKLSDIRKHWKMEIQWGQVQLIRELDKQPDLSMLEATKKMLEGILSNYAAEQKHHKKQQNRKNKRQI